MLIVDDPDAPDPAAPKMTWVHWVLYNIPPSASALPEATRQLPAGTLEGVNDWKRTGYGGPCPPIGRHRYFHKLYALGLHLGDAIVEAWGEAARLAPVRLTESAAANSAAATDRRTSGPTSGGLRRGWGEIMTAPPVGLYR